MLEKIDLSRKISKAEFKSQLGPLELKLGDLQRRCRTMGIPVLIVFEGWDAAGKGTMINRLMLAMDARGFKVHPINPPTEDERLRPHLWRFWTKIPPGGRFAIFDRSWYGRVLVARVDRIIKKKDWSRAYGEINTFERQLSDNGAVIIKFFLHISKKEQKRRFEKIIKNKATAWKVSKHDLRHHKQYEKYEQAVEDMLSRTNNDYAPWNVIAAHDLKYALVRMFTSVNTAIERRIAQLEQVPATSNSRPVRLPELPNSILDMVDTSKSMEREEYRRLLKKYQNRVHDLEHEIYVKRIPVVILYEGWDAAGKGGNIRRLVQGLDPRGYEVIPVGAPNEVEKSYHYLWRFWQMVPKAGHITIFDRSWYGRVMVERIEGFCSEDEWKRAYGEINEMEAQWVNSSLVLIKFWLHIDADEQLRRFEARQQNPEKTWKITDEDWRNREKWPQYKEAVDEMLFRTSTSHAPWTIIEANSKWYARIKALKTVIERLETALQRK